jgi:hypothetical protein
LGRAEHGRPDPLEQKRFMSPEDFRRIALSMPKAVEVFQLGHPVFRVGRKAFATLEGPANSTAVVRLTPDQQAMFMSQAPTIFAPVAGGWGRLGSTNVQLTIANRATVEEAIAAAWGNVAESEVR